MARKRLRERIGRPTEVAGIYGQVYGGFAAVLFGLALAGVTLLAAVPDQRRWYGVGFVAVACLIGVAALFRVLHLAEQAWTWRDREHEETTMRDGRASAQRQAMVSELRALNAALVPRSRALRRSARPYH